MESVTVSDHSRDPMLRAPIDLVLPIYKALNKYCNMLTEPENTLTYKMENGNKILSFYRPCAFDVIRLPSIIGPVA